MNIGDKVVCVDDSPCCNCGAPSALKKNAVYVVSGVRVRYNQMAVDIVGLRPACHKPHTYISYRATRFRHLNQKASATASTIASRCCRI